MSDQDTTKINRYLLGQLPQEEVDRIEARLLSETGLFELAESVEDEIIDRYVRGELDAVVGRMRSEGHDVAWVGCGVPDGDAHAGVTETSVMLHLAPDLVRPHDGVTGETRPLAALMPDLVARGIRAVSPSGVLGDPAGASAERGREILEAMVSSVVHRIGGGS